jgi:polynucleotide 5'-hydroxyl-kinase GRC3/NOL9
MIAGTYSLTPLQQVIRLLNTTLAPDGLAYPVFAPTSHPIPVIQPASATSRIVSPLLRSLELPKGFRLVDGKEPRTVVLIREHACGLEGLKAGAVPGFTNAFLDGAGIWGLRGVQPVRKSH